MRKVFVSIVALACIMAISTSVFARYLCITGFSDNTTITSTSVSSSAKATLKSSYQATIKIVLEVSKDGGKTYSTDSTLTSKTSTGISIQTITATKSNLNSSYDYRVKTTLSVYDSSGYEIDGDVMYSY